jgi:putative flippase GtrA
MTTIVNYVVFFALRYILRGTGIEEKLSLTISEVVAFIISVLFSYFPNKIAVFDSYDFSFKKVIIEMFLFYMSRIFSLLAELLILLITVTNLHWNEVIMKIIASVVVVILNYVFSKLFVFKKSLLREKPQKIKEENNG